MHEYARLVKIHHALKDVDLAEPETLAEALYELRKEVSTAMEGFSPFCKAHPEYTGLRKPRSECARCWTIWMIWGDEKNWKQLREIEDGDDGVLRRSRTSVGRSGCKRR